MDPITAAVISLVVWIVIRTALAVVIVFTFVALGTWASDATENPLWMIGGALVGWILAIVWELYALIQVILDIINIWQLVA